MSIVSKQCVVLQMFLSFKEKGLVTCSTDHLLIIWKDGELQSQLRSLAVFQKLEDIQEVWLWSWKSLSRPGRVLNTNAFLCLTNICKAFTSVF